MLLPGPFLKFVGICLITIGVYDTNVYRYALTKGLGTFDFFGRELPAKHPIVKMGFGVVLLFYYSVGLVLLVFG
jgi:hypothetical protein